METKEDASMKPEYWLGWLLVSIVGWTIGSLFTTGGDTRSISEIIALFPPLIANGFLIGIVNGVGQTVLLQRIVSSYPKNWRLATIVGSTLLAPVGLVIVTMVAWISFQIQGQQFLPSGGTMFFNPSPMYMIAGGFVLGLTQWMVLRNLLIESGGKIGSLWILGTWAGIGTGVFIGMWARGHMFNLPALAQRIIENAITGAIIGVVTATILLIIARGARGGNKVFTAHSVA